MGQAHMFHPTAGHQNFNQLSDQSNANGSGTGQCSSTHQTPNSTTSATGSELEQQTKDAIAAAIQSSTGTSANTTAKDATV